MTSYKTIYIAGINRSGGSLLSRLYDNHSSILSYPTELGFPSDNSFYDIVDSYAGVPQSIPDYFKSQDQDLFSLLDLPKKQAVYSTQWGKEKSEPLGVRENYLEKNFYGNIKTYFDYDIFIEIFNEKSIHAQNIKELYDARHYAYFSAWENGKYLKDQSHVVMQDSGGIYLTNIDRYFNEFTDSILLYPIRDITGYVATEKVRYARRFYGSRRFASPQLPNYFVKNYNYYDIEAQIKGWLCAVTRVRLLQEKYGINDRFVIYNHSALTSYPELTMKSLINKSSLKYEETLVNPTIGGKDWLGNSHYGPTKGISNSINKNYNKVLRRDELDIISSLSGELCSHIDNKNTPVSLLDIPENLFYDYEIQKKYIDEKQKISLYYALTNSTKRRYKITQAPIYSIFAIIFSLIVRLAHIPRILKLRYFKGKGKQNYT